MRPEAFRGTGVPATGRDRNTRSTRPRGRGPAIFMQERVGRDGKPFMLYKFRTMQVDAEARLFELGDLNDTDGALFKMREDPRITRVGRWLRATAMDELPQLWSIFRGDMSFVGPRALRPGEIEVGGSGELEALEDVPGFAERCRVPPGLTGVAQIYARRDLPRRQKFRYDRLYIRRQSFGLEGSRTWARDLAGLDAELTLGGELRGDVIHNGLHRSVGRVRTATVRTDAIRQYSLLDYAATVFGFATISIPAFFLALAGIYVFAIQLRWLPSAGMATIGQPPSLVDSIEHLILPATVLGLAQAAPLIRYTRSSMLETVRQDYVRVARAKGLSERIVISRHALRNALIPLVTVVALTLPQLLGGTVISESDE